MSVPFEVKQRQSVIRSLADARWLRDAPDEELVAAIDGVWRQAFEAAVQVRGWIQDLRPAPGPAEASFERIEDELQRLALAEREIRLGIDPRAHAERILDAWRVLRAEHAKWDDGAF